MIRALSVICLMCCLSVQPALAQDPIRPGMFRDYDSLQLFIEDRLSRNEFVSLIGGLLPASAFDDVQALEFQLNLREYLTSPLSGLASVRSTTSPDGIREEIIALWNAESQYFFLSLVTHPREDGLVVLLAYIDGSLDDAYANF